MKKQLSLKIFGNVQGVGFRNWAQNNAASLDINGYIKNEPDNTVSILAQGKEKNLEKFLKMCYDGPSFAQVTHVTPEWQEITEPFSRFDIL